MDRVDICVSVQILSLLSMSAWPGLGQSPSVKGLTSAVSAEFATPQASTRCYYLPTPNATINTPRPRKHQQHTSAFCSVSASFLHALTYDPRRIAFATDGNMLDGRMICATSRLEQISSLHLPMILLRRRLSTSINDCRLRALFGE